MFDSYRDLLFSRHCVEFNLLGGVIQDQMSSPCNDTFPKYVMSFIDQPLLINVILSSESYIISILASGLYPMVEWGIFIFRFLDFTFKKNAFVAYINECLNAMYIY